MASGKRARRKSLTSISKKSQDGSDSDVDIPYAKKDPPGPADDESEADDEEEEEYAVEKILAHQWKGKKLLFEVKWVGYEETTIEPEENLDGCPEELAAYYKKTGGRPERAGTSKTTKVTSKDSIDGRKRSLPVQNDAKSNGRGSKRSKTSESGGSKTFQPPKGSWEDHIIGVETISRNDDGNLEGYIEWSSGERTRHPTRLLNIKCPQVMLRFYEANLIFTPQDDAPAPSSKNTADATSIKPDSVSTTSISNNATKPVAPIAKMDISEDDDDDMDNVKAVAHA